MIEKQKSSPVLPRAVAGGEYGIQPLDALMERRGLSNTDVVKAATVPVTHKMIQKARQGRRLSRKVQNKVCHAFNAALASRPPEDDMVYRFEDLFNYDGR
jgi:hypothetical protein